MRIQNSFSYKKQYYRSVFFMRLLSLFTIVCCVGCGLVVSRSASALPITLPQPVGGLKEFDTCDLTREELEQLIKEVKVKCPGEFGCVVEIRKAIRSNDYCGGGDKAEAVVGENEPVGVDVAGEHPEIVNQKRASLVIGDADGKWSRNADGKSTPFVEGDPTQTKIENPRWVQVQRDGSLLVRTDELLRVSPDRRKVVQAAKPGMIGPSDHIFSNTPDGSLLISGRYGVARVSADGQRVSWVIGTGRENSRCRFKEKDPSQTEVKDPRVVGVGQDGSTIVFDSSNHRVLRVSADNEKVTHIIGAFKNGAAFVEHGAAFVEKNPKRTQLGSVTTDFVVERDGSLLVVDEGNHRVLRVSADDKRVSRVIGTDNYGTRLAGDNPGETQLSGSLGVIVDNHDDSLLIMDHGNYRVLRVSADGRRVTRVIGTDEPGDALIEDDPTKTQISGTRSVKIGRDGSLLISDRGNYRVLRVTADGQRVSNAFSVNKPESEKDPNYHCPPQVIAGLQDGSLVILLHAKVVRVSADGQNVTSVIGTGRDDPWGDHGVSASSSLNEDDPAKTALGGCWNCTLDHDGSLLVCDEWRHRVLRVILD